jgi:hypothetical protein
MSMKLRLLLVIAGIVLLAGCSGNADAPASPTIDSTATVVVEEAARGPAFLTPVPVGSEEPLEGDLAGIPESYVVPGRQSIDALARYLKTEADQLRRVNGPMDDILLPGTIVLVPNTFYAQAGSTLSGVSAATGIPENQLSAANPDIDGALETSTLLAMPPLVIAQRETDISTLAASLNTDAGALLSANPDLTDADTVQAGTVLIAPLPGTEP